MDTQALVDQYNESQEDKQANQESQTHESNESSQEANESSQEETPAEPSILSDRQTANIVLDTVYGAYFEHWNLNQAFIYNIKKAA